MKGVWPAGTATTGIALAIATALASGCQPQPPESGDPADTAPDYSSVFDGTAGRWLDLSHSYSEETIYWPTAEPFRLEEAAFGETDAGFFYSAYNFSTAEHGGTHLDAPLHFARGQAAADEVPLSRLIGAAVVVDVSARAEADYQVSAADLEAFEREHGPIPDGAILLIRTGWGER